MLPPLWPPAKVPGRISKYNASSLIYTFSPVRWATTKKTRWATTYTKNFAPNCVPPLNFWGGPKKVGQYTHTKNTLHMLKTPFLVRFFSIYRQYIPWNRMFKGGRGGGFSIFWIVNSYKRLISIERASIKLSCNPLHRDSTTDHQWFNLLLGN